MKITNPTNWRFSNRYWGILSFIAFIVVANVIHFATHQNNSPHEENVTIQIPQTQTH